MDLITLADLPELPAGEKAPRSTIVVARLDDKLYDPRYGAFKIQQSDVDGWKRNLSDTFGGRVSIDFDHSSDRGQGTKAAAWITALNQSGADVTADVEWTPTGAKSVRDGDYRFISPTFVSNFVDEHKESRGRALIGAALTNRPVLRKGMPTLSLSKDSFQGVAVPDGSETTSAKRERKRARKLAATALARDSRPHMDLPELAKQLGLAEDADHVTILAKVAAMGADKSPGAKSASPGSPPPPGWEKKAAKAAKKAKKAKKLSQGTLTLDDGATSLSAEKVAELFTAANAGQAAALQLAEQTFDVAWAKALSEGRAAPAQEDTMRALHRENSDIAIKTLDSFVQIVPVKPAGSGEGAPAGPAPLGMDDDRFALHTQAKALAQEKRKSNPNLDDGEAYSLAVLELEDRKFLSENPGI